MTIKEYIEKRLICLESMSNEDIQTCAGKGITFEVWNMAGAFDERDLAVRAEKQNKRAYALLDVFYKEVE